MVNQMVKTKKQKTGRHSANNPDDNKQPYKKQKAINFYELCYQNSYNNFVYRMVKKMDKKTEMEPAGGISIMIDDDMARSVFTGGGQKPRILHLDDEELVLSLFKLYFNDLYSITSVSNEHEAIEKLSNEKYDLVVADYQMHEMDGPELLRRIRVKVPEMQVVFLSSLEQVELADKALKSGGYDFIIKNYSDPLFRLKMKQTIANAIEYSKIRFRLQMQIALFMNLLSATEKSISLVDAKTNEVIMSNAYKPAV